MKKYNSTNREATKSAEFNLICLAAGVDTTKRQVSKFRNQKGLAYKYYTSKINRDNYNG